MDGCTALTLNGWRDALTRDFHALLRDEKGLRTGAPGWKPWMDEKRQLTGVPG